jgi:hypothetical protein
MTKNSKLNPHKRSHALRLLTLVLVIGVLIGLYVIGAISTPDETIWAPGPDWGYFTPNDRA